MGTCLGGGTVFAPRDSLGLFGFLGLLGLLAHPPALVLSFRASKKVPLGTGDTGEYTGVPFKRSTYGCAGGVPGNFFG